MIEPTIISSDAYRSAQRLKSWIYEIPSVGVLGTSDEIQLQVGVKEGSIAVVRISCDSEDYKLSVRSKPGVIVPTIYEILNVVNIDKSYNEVYNPKIIFSNGEEPAEQANLYAVITNNDTVVTGAIMMELIISKM